MRTDLLQIIKSAADVTNAIILTQNIDFIFVQSVLLPALRKCGAPTLTIFADAECATSTYSSQAAVLGGLGTRYRVVPVDMAQGLRFHPKAVLLSGPETGTLLVGSGNLTFGGWRENGEIWSRYDSDRQGTAPLAAFRQYLGDVVALCADPGGGVAREVEEAFDPITRAWADTMAAPDHLLGRAGKGDSLVAQMRATCGEGAVERLYVCTPYFDAEGEALRTLSESLSAANTTVLIHGRHCNLPAEAAAALGEEYRLQATSFHHDGEGDEGREGMLHAKFYAVQQGNDVIVFAGSANCSRAALTLAGSRGNAELMAWATIPREQFEREFIAELNISDTPPELSWNAQDSEGPLGMAECIRVHAARFELGRVLVAYSCDPLVHVSGIESDGVLMEPTELGEDWLIYHPGREPRGLVLIGHNADQTVRSRPHWVDHELELRTSARGRSLAEEIYRRVQPEAWGIGAWTEILSEFHKHLRYNPRVLARSLGAGEVGGTGSQDSAEFEWADVFTEGYGSRSQGVHSSALSIGRGLGIGRLRALLLRWLGVLQPEADVDGAAELTEAYSPETEVPGAYGESMDRPEGLPARINPSATIDATDRERKRACELIEQVASSLSDPDYLRDRHSELLAVDLKMAAALFRVGLNDGWLGEEEFRKASLAIWVPLFLDAGGEKGLGWLAHRYEITPDKERFESELSSVELAAALVCWVLCMPSISATPRQAQFELAAIQSIARLPWLWRVNEWDQVGEEVDHMLAHGSLAGRIEQSAVDGRWRKLVRRGFALDCIWKALAEFTPAQIRARVSVQQVHDGELLWQGSAGFCVAKADCPRDDRHMAEVLVLKGQDLAKFKGSFLIPVTGLLGDDVVDRSKLTDQVRHELTDLAAEFRVAASDR